MSEPVSKLNTAGGENTLSLTNTKYTDLHVNASTNNWSLKRNIKDCTLYDKDFVKYRIYFTVLYDLFSQNHNKYSNSLLASMNS